MKMCLLSHFHYISLFSILSSAVESANDASARLQDEMNPTTSPTTTDGSGILTYSFCTIVALLQCVLAYIAQYM